MERVSHGHTSVTKFHRFVSQCTGGDDEWPELREPQIRESIPVEHRAAVAVLEDVLGEMTVVDVVEWHMLSHPALGIPCVTSRPCRVSTLDQYIPDRARAYRISCISLPIHVSTPSFGGCRAPRMVDETAANDGGFRERFVATKCRPRNLRKQVGNPCRATNAQGLLGVCLEVRSVVLVDGGIDDQNLLQCLDDKRSAPTSKTPNSDQQEIGSTINDTSTRTLKATSPTTTSIAACPTNG